MPVGFFYPAAFAYVSETPATKIVIEHVGGGVEAAWTTHHRHPFPDAPLPLSRFGGSLYIEADIVCDHQVELAVAIIIDKGATGSPLSATSGNPGSPAHFFERAIVLIVVEPVGPVIRDVQIIESIIVVITHASSLAPSARGESGSECHVAKRAIAIVVVEMTRGMLLASIQRVAVDQGDVGPTMMVIIDDS